MFLTRMQLNPQRRGAQKLLSSPQAMHAAVLAAFADPQPSPEARVLWRVDTYERQRVLLYVVSPDQPDLTHVAEQAGWPTTEAWDARPYDGLLDSLRPGQHWHFRLTANPVRSGRRSDWVDTKPLAHVTAAQQHEWLLARVERLGFKIPASGVDGVTPDVAVVHRAVRRFSRGDSRVTISMATFEGHLEVQDPAALRRSLLRGVGRAKAYGCGLLTLAPVATARVP